MLESKLKRRYTWPVELLGVIVEDGEVIIGTQEQIFPNGQINADFINLQHQRNLNLQQSNSSSSSSSSKQNQHITLERGRNKSDSDSTRVSIAPFPKQGNHSSSSGLGKHPTGYSGRGGGNGGGGGSSTTTSDDEQEQQLRHSALKRTDGYTIFSPKIINIAGSSLAPSNHQVQVDHGEVCTCSTNTNKSDDAGESKKSCCVGATSHSSSVEIEIVKNKFPMSGPPNNNVRNCHTGRCPKNKQGGSGPGLNDQHRIHNDSEENFQNNEILQVQVSSLYPLTEEDVFTTTSTSQVEPNPREMETQLESKSGSAKKSTFQPIQGKFNFLRKKSRDSRKKKQQQNSSNPSKPSGSSSITVGGIMSNSGAKSTLNNGHKDYCPHSKVFQVKSVSPPGGRSSGGDIRDNFYVSGGSTVSGASSSNNNTPSHHSSSHLSSSNQNSQSVSHCPQSDPISGSPKSTANCRNTCATSSAKTGDNIVERRGSVLQNGTLGGGGNLNCKALHPETEGKIPSANGTATGAMALQVNTANGDVKKVITLWQNYYPESGWGYIILFCAMIVQAINHGLQLSYSTFLMAVNEKFRVGDPALLGLLGSLSVAVSLFFSPLWVALCKQKSTRLAGVFGGLIASLGVLFTSFSTQFHQLFISYGAFVGVGVGLTRDASTLMVGQYFKRKRDIVEILVVSGSGLGILFMSVSINTAIRSIGWRLGLQAVTGTILSTFFLGTCYRSASLYHPQRRAILHLKNQKKKVKDLARREEKPPLIDYSCLKSKTLQILLLSSAFIAFGINAPLFYLSMECRDEMDSFSTTLLHMYLGAAWIIGCCLFGLIVVQKSQECRVSKQYLCQVASVICGIAIMALIAANGHNGLAIFVWVYGFSFGGYSYSLKVYTYERVRARHFARAWSFVQWSQAIPVLVSIPLIGYLNDNWGRSYGYCLSALSVFIGSACLFLTDVRRRRLSRRKAEKSSMKTCETLESAHSPKIRRLSFAFPVEQMSPQSKHDSGDGQGSQVDAAVLSKELTCISEELADMDFQDIYFEDWAEFFGGDCITSCNKVENCLASEYDAEFALLLDRRVRRWSTARSSIGFSTHGGIGGASTVGSGLAGQPHILSSLVQSSLDNNGESGTPLPIESLRVPGPREIPVFKNHPWGSRPPPAQRPITVIDEASV